ncbi:MAG: AHH domain-containing protein [Verrucomicrobia subdivision 3 bacterium]|nr:AHH domain-containing protein [Limisphaerales bacterium]
MEPLRWFLQFFTHLGIVRAAVAEFNFNGAKNGIRLPKTQHNGSHPKYTSAIESKLDKLFKENPNLSPEQARSILENYTGRIKNRLAEQVSGTQRLR